MKTISIQGYRTNGDKFQRDYHIGAQQLNRAGQQCYMLVKIGTRQTNFFNHFFNESTGVITNGLQGKRRRTIAEGCLDVTEEGTLIEK